MFLSFVGPMSRNCVRVVRNQAPGNNPRIPRIPAIMVMDCWPDSPSTRAGGQDDGSLTNSLKQGPDYSYWTRPGLLDKAQITRQGADRKTRPRLLDKNPRFYQICPTYYQVWQVFYQNFQYVFTWGPSGWAPWAQGGPYLLIYLIIWARGGPWAPNEFLFYRPLGTNCSFL